jgi:hypothetical protein
MARSDARTPAAYLNQADDLPLDAIGAEIAAVPLDRYVAYVESAHGRP